MDEDQVLVTFSRKKKKLIIRKNGFLSGFEVSNEGKNLRFSPFFQNFQGFFSIVQVYQESDILFLTGDGREPTSSQRILTVFEARAGQVLCEVFFQYKIKAVTSNLTRAAVLIEDQAVVMKTENFVKIAVVSVCGQFNLIELSMNVEFCFLVFPNSEDKGYVGVFDCFNSKPVTSFSCHKSVLARMALSETGKQLATASVKGTIIRVFDCITGDLVHQLKRGLSAAEIYEIQFFNRDRRIFVTSSSGTLHMFDTSRLEDREGFKSFLASWLPEKCSDHLKSVQSSSVFSTGFEGRHSIGWTEDLLILVDESSRFLILSQKNNGFEKIQEGKLTDLLPDVYVN